MRLFALLFTATLAATPALAQPASSSAESTAQEPASASQDTSRKDAQDPEDAKDRALNLPVSLDNIRDGLQHKPALSLRTLDERPTFRVQILERQKIEELLATLNFKTGPTPAGGIYMYEQQRQMFNPVDRPLMQPYAAFSSGQLLTILIENLVGKYLGGKAIDAVSKMERARAEANAKEEVRAAVAQYCNAQPNLGVGMQICDTAR
jgi:ribosomal protein L12E/L44/L45/RPP1/RPP2